MTLPNTLKVEIEKLRNDNESGARELSSKAIEIINIFSREINSDKNLESLLIELFSQIINARPSMAPLINTIGYLYDNLQEYTTDSIIKVIEKFNAYQSEIKKRLDRNFSAFIHELNNSKPRIMLISYSSTILDLLNKQNNIDFIFYILESRPLNEGQKTAELLGDKFETHLIIDAAVGKFMDNVDVILIGIDSVLDNGNVINKIGTYPLSVLAKSKRKPVYAIGDSLKYNLRSYFDLPVEIIKKPSIEVIGRKEHNFLVENFYFDITPAKFIHRIISDLGILMPKKFIEEVKKSIPLDWFKNFM
jgi:translation initiation factor 2B subunit (eIF-2B alpha/beta/delta family)